MMRWWSLLLVKWIIKVLNVPRMLTEEHLSNGEEYNTKGEESRCGRVSGQMLFASFRRVSNLHNMALLNQLLWMAVFGELDDKAHTWMSLKSPNKQQLWHLSIKTNRK